jgi:lipopolysaccharide transport system permease protein
MKKFSVKPQEFLGTFIKNRSLIKTLVQREVLGRYKGSLFGIFWSFFTPFFMLAVYTFVFSIVFKARWSGGNNSKSEFALVLFAGLIIFNIFAECINRAPSLILSNVNYVKKVVFPLEILPIVSLCSALFHASISYLVWLLAYAFFYGAPHGTVLLMPFILIPLALFVLGLTWGLASLGVYLRDVSQIVGIFTTVVMFLSPIFYPVNALPERFQIFVKLNPLAPVIEQARQILFWGQYPDLKEYLIGLFIALLIAYLGFFWFQKTRKGFADVI